jgi:hypothetical protein
MRTFIILLLFVAGCQETTYRHREWTDGKIASDIQVSNKKAMAGTATEGLEAVLADGTSIGVKKMVLAPDPNSIKAIGEALRPVIIDLLREN